MIAWISSKQLLNVCIKNKYLRTYIHMSRDLLHSISTLSSIFPNITYTPCSCPRRRRNIKRHTNKYILHNQRKLLLLFLKIQPDGCLRVGVKLVKVEFLIKCREISLQGTISQLLSNLNLIIISEYSFCFFFLRNFYYFFIVMMRGRIWNCNIITGK